MQLAGLLTELVTAAAGNILKSETKQCTAASDDCQANSSGNTCFTWTIFTLP